MSVSPVVSLLAQPSTEFIPDKTEAGRVLRGIDWSRTPLGPEDTWSPTLRMMVPFVLASRFPQLLWWGPEYICIYNDGYIPVLGTKHPSAMGRPMREVWSEVWEVLRPLIDTPFHGGPASWVDDIELELRRHGFVEEAHFLFAYSPVPDESVPSKIGGVIATVIEITDKIVTERRVALLRDLGSRVAEMGDDTAVCVEAAEVLAGHHKDVPFAILYLFDRSGEKLTLTARTGIDAEAAGPAILTMADCEASRWPLGAALSTETLQIRRDVAGLPSVNYGVSAIETTSVVVVPIKSNISNRPAGALVVGVSPRLRYDSNYAGFLEMLAAQIATAVASKRAYDEERRRAAALAELDRAKTTFFSNVSHEFRTPLTLILAPLEDLLASTHMPAASRAPLDVAHRNSLRLLKLVNSLLDFARIEAGRVQAAYRPTDLAAVTEDLASNFRSAMERAGLEFDVRCESLPEPVHVDPDMWEKIVLNLLSNAFKFTLHGKVSVRLSQDGEAAQLQVADTGVGVPSEEVPRLFERFHRVEGTQARTQEGSGIGLALVQELVKLHGGTISAASTPGVGSEFRVRIPFGTAHLPKSSALDQPKGQSTAISSQAFVQEALRWLPEDSGPAPATLRGDAHTTADTDRRFAAIHGARVLLADDNADMRSYLRQLLGDYYRVETVQDGEAALRAARRDRPDLILTDVMMPHLDGFGLLRALREDSMLRNIPVVLLSARAGEEARIEGLNAGADDYVVKPFSARELLTRIGALLELNRTRSDSEQRFRAFVQAMSDAVYRMTPDWQEMRELQGRNFLADTQDPSRSWLDKYIPEDERPRVLEAIRVAIAAQEPFELEHRIIKANGETGWSNSRAIPVYDKQGEIIEWFGATTDVTEQHSAQEALLEQRQQLEDAARQKDEFLAMLAHELRNPLAPIRNSGELLLRKLPDDATLRSAVQTIERQVIHLARIVDDLLDVSRITQGRIELRRRPCVVADIIARSIETVDPQIRQRQQKLTIGPSRWNLYVNADPERLVQCLANVLTNASKFTEPGGQIQIETQEIGGEISIVVTDNGEGITPELLPKVFELFVQDKRTLDRAQGGLGIGLSLVKRLIEMHGGSVGISSPGRRLGTRFEMRLPRLERPIEGSQPVAPGLSRPRKILVVDDNEDAADSLAMVLRLEGHTVAVANSGVDALQYLEEQRAEIVLLDLGLPGLDGYQVAERIRANARWDDLKLVALTGYGTDTDRQRTQSAGFVHHLIKPLEFSDLRRVLNA